jgi:hypothetical protein
MQREGAVPDSLVQNKMTRIASLDQSTKRLELLARRGGKWCLNFAVWLRRSSFQHHQIATGSPTIDILACFFLPVFVLDHFAGLALLSPCRIRISAGMRI